MQFDLLDPVHNEIISTSTYAEFSERLRKSNCKRCPLCEKRTNIVIDRGNHEAAVMIVSERPGENEDRQGKAFVGRAGELLDKIFAAIGMDTNRDLLITNVVKCMPEVDRSPQSGEVAACLPYLEKQIDLIKPKVIVLLGAVALKYVTGEHGAPASGSAEFSMEEEAGKFFTLPAFPGIQFMVLYHPAFLLRDPSKKKVMWEHVQKLRDYLKATAETQSAQRETIN
jgi:uracil-DNA glycosylase family 4